MKSYEQPKIINYSYTAKTNALDSSGSYTCVNKGDLIPKIIF